MAKTKKKTSLSVNFEGVEGKRALLPEDDYRLEVEEVSLEEGDKAPYLKFTFFVADGKHKGSKIWDNASTSSKSLWRLRSILECLGVEVPDDELEIDLEDLVGRQMMGVVHHERDPDYGTKARMSDFYAIEGSEPDEEEEEEKPKKDKGKKSKSNEDDGDEDEDAKKARRRKERRAERKKSKSEDDGDEDEKSSKKSDKKADKKKAKKVTADDISEMDEDELKEILEKFEIEEDTVDLDDYPTLKKKRAAVQDALEDAGHLESDDD